MEGISQALNFGKNVHDNGWGMFIRINDRTRATSCEKLAKEQRILSRRKKGSNRWHKQRLKVANLHEKVANQRRDFLHKLSHHLASKYDCVVVKDLNTKGMSQALHFGKSVTDNTWGMFTTFFQYKLEEQGTRRIADVRVSIVKRTLGTRGIARSISHREPPRFKQPERVGSGG